MVEDPLNDASTTQPGARVRVLVGLALMALYLLGGVVSAAERITSPGHEGADLFWLGRWQMFTDLRPHHTELRAEFWQRGVWTEVELTDVCPNSWQEGPGFHRSSFWRDGQKLGALGRQICAETDSPRVRLYAVRWDKSLGSLSQPEVGLVRRDLLEAECRRDP
jgi:hypothetical protein